MRSFQLRTRLRLFRVGLHLLGGAAQVALLFPFVGEGGRQRRRAHWSRRLLALLDIRVEAGGNDTPGLERGLLVANHISFTDIFVINSGLPSAFVAKSEVAGWPLIGWLARRNDTVFIERGNRRAAHQAQQGMVAALAGGQRLAIFPEGTTTSGDRVLPFHGALLQSAIDAAVPVHALLLSYHAADGSRSTAPAYVGDLSVMDCLQSILRARGLVARVRVVASFPPPLADRRYLATRAHEAIASGLGRESVARHGATSP